MFNFLSSSASSNFQQLRLQLTSPNHTSPSPKIMNCTSNEIQFTEMINILKGEDITIRPQIGYATIISKMLKSQQSNSWIFHLKNLNLLSRLIHQHLFIHDIAGLNLTFINSLPQISFEGMRTAQLIECYWKLLRYEAVIVDSETHVLCYKRSQRILFLSELNSDQKMNQMQVLQSLFRLAYEVVKQMKMNEQKMRVNLVNCSQLVVNLLQQVMQKLLRFYSCQLLCCHSLLAALQLLEPIALRKLKKLCARFKANSLQFIKFLQDYKFIKLFEQFNYQQLNPFQSANLPSLIDELIQMKESDNSPILPFLSHKSFNPLKVQFFPDSQLMDPSLLRPRLISVVQDRKQMFNQFKDWNSSFSDEFPQKQVMTLDLILDIKRSKELGAKNGNVQKVMVNGEQKQLIYDLSLTGESYDDCGNCIQAGHQYKVNFEDTKHNSNSLELLKSKPMHHAKLPNFKNSYSSLIQNWNQC